MSQMYAKYKNYVIQQGKYCTFLSFGLILYIDVVDLTISVQ